MSHLLTISAMLRLLRIVQEGMAATIQHSMKAVTSLIRRKKLRAYIHPVPPVLDPTRAIVCTYNGHYEQAVRAAQSSLATPASMRWLDVFEPMLEVHTAADGREKIGLNPQFALDGTHLSPLPAYVPLLGHAMAAADATL